MSRADLFTCQHIGLTTDPCDCCRYGRHDDPCDCQDCRDAVEAQQELEFESLKAEEQS